MEKVKCISDLCWKEFEDYKLIQLDQSYFHDRNLRVDNNIFAIGSGMDQAGKHPTNFDPADSTPKAHKVFDNLIKKGTVVHSSVAKVL